jgi:hypothetical protein|tara:strand:- start:1749 stop:1940 length:192 start_codon:yes stop_codon:yes gene_type:complete
VLLNIAKACEDIELSIRKIDENEVEEAKLILQKLVEQIKIPLIPESSFEKCPQNKISTNQFHL